MLLPRAVSSEAVLACTGGAGEGEKSEVVEVVLVRLRCAIALSLVGISCRVIVVKYCSRFVVACDENLTAV